MIINITIIQLYKKSTILYTVCLCTLWCRSKNYQVLLQLFMCGCLDHYLGHPLAQ